jgi:hypothetical protein
MSKITAEHLARSAYVYIRQSTADQLTHNHESQRRQYGLVNRAKHLGWTDVEVIDDDLGRSGGGIARPGFERLLAAICEARVGAVLAIEASRLARNGRDWHTLIEFCGLVGTIIVDEDGIYDPRHPNDRLHTWLRDEAIELPVKSRSGETRGIIWRLPAYNTVHNILTNPIYAGAYAFGRTTSRVSIENGRKRVRRGVHRPMAEWDVLIKNHHEAYITWDEFERNLHVIANNANGKGSAKVKGAVRRGELLLPGLLRCGHCGRKLHVSYNGKLGRYSCSGARTDHGTARCISISGLSIDAAVSTEVLHILKPLGIDAAVTAIETQTSETSAAQRQRELSLQQARYEAAHARRQYDAVDPANRLVAGELERRWNEALQVVQRIEGEIAAIVSSKPPTLGERERQQLMQLGADLELAWSHPAATATTRKRILRAALNEIVVCKEGAIIHAVLHWQGGDHTALQIKQRLNAGGRHHWPPEDTISLVRELARLMPDRQIARLLNRCGKPTGYSNGWTQQRVRGFRGHHGVAVYRDGERAERGEITLDTAAEIIGVCKMTALRMIRRGDIKGRQVCTGAPWVIKAEDVAAFAARKRSSASVTPNPLQQAFEFQ